MRTFADELSELLPAGLPNRDSCITGAARHLDLIVEANQQFNLTRIVTPRGAAIKHVLDSVLPWRFFAEERHVVDAGSGAGFPGVPLALVLPHVRFTLLESTLKRARFLESVVANLDLPNVEVVCERAEDWLKRFSNSAASALVTARAVAPMDRALPLFGPAVRKGTRLLLYKGPDAATEIGDAAPQAAKEKCEARILDEYLLPDGMGSRTIVEVRRRTAKGQATS